MSIPVKYVVGSPITALPFDAHIEQIIQWASRRESRVVCVANVHMVTEAHRNEKFATVLQEADMVTPDGMPLVWMMKILGERRQNRVAGMDILLALCHQAMEKKMSVFFVGSQSMILERMRQRLEREFPTLQIAGMEPLPFRPLTPQEDETLIRKIHTSGAGIVFISLGCPKQEIWMNRHKNRLQSVMVGVGGVFPVYAGIHRRAPRWARELGLEWLYRLFQEPRRLWPRYSQTIPPFLYLACKQLLLAGLSVQRFKASLSKTRDVLSTVPSEQLETELVFDNNSVRDRMSLTTHCHPDVISRPSK